jgi:hypothetical protein
VKLRAALGLLFLSTLAAQPPIAGKLVASEGSITVDGPQMPPGYLQVALTPVGSGEVLLAEVRSNGTFTISSVIPGHWRLSVPGLYLKSVTRGERKLSAADIDIGAEAGPPLKIVAGSNFARLKVTSSVQPPPTKGILVFVFIDGDANGPIFPVTPDGSGIFVPGGSMSVPPGRHLVCAFTGVQPWMTPAASADFRALRPALESHCRTVQFSEGVETSIQAVEAPFISAERVRRLREQLPAF